MMVATELRRLFAPQTHEAAEARVGSDDKPMLLWVRLVPSAGQAGDTLEGAILLTPYTVDVITEDARRASPGARLQVTVPSAIDEVAFASVRERLAWLADRGVDVEVSREPQPKPPRRDVAATKAEPFTLHVRSAAVGWRLAHPGRL